MTRDTSSDWILIGDTEPWWGVLSTSKFLKVNLNDQAIEDFYAQGQTEIAETAKLLADVFGFSRVKTAVDFGSGLGRLACAMRNYADFVYGVDVSPGMINEAIRQSSKRGTTSVSYVHALPDDQGVDWINSYIVFQHINPHHGYRILGELLSRLNVGGYVSLQLLYCHDHRHTTEITRDVESYVFDGSHMRVLEERPRVAGAMVMYDYDLNQVMRLLHKGGLKDVLTRHTDHGGAHGVWLFAKRSA